MLSAFQTTSKMNTKGLSGRRCPRPLQGRSDEACPRPGRRSGAPPTARTTTRRYCSGLLASYSFDSMKELLDRELRYSPLGYRVWRAITKLVTLSGLPGTRADKLRVWVSELLEDSEQLRDRGSMYAGRALDMELAVAVPEAWSPPGDDDWVSPLLLRRAENARTRRSGTRRSSHGAVGTRGSH